MQCSQRLTVVATGRLSSLMFFSLIFFFVSMAWFERKLAGNLLYSYKLYINIYIYIHIPRDKPWIPVDFPLNLNQSIVYDTIGIFSRPVSSRRRCSKTSTGTRRS